MVLLLLVILTFGSVAKLWQREMAGSQPRVIVIDVDALDSPSCLGNSGIVFEGNVDVARIDLWSWRRHFGLVSLHNLRCMLNAWLN